MSLKFNAVYTDKAGLTAKDLRGDYALKHRWL
jgi:hypothetical protein